MVNEHFSATAHDEILLAAGVDADDAHAHAARGDLRGQMAQTTTGAQQRDPIAGLGAGFAQRAVHGDAGAEHGSRHVRGQRVRDGRDIAGGTRDVLLERPRGVVTRDFLVEADPVVARATRGTRVADGGNPFDTHTLSNFDRCRLRPGSHLHDLADAFVSAHLARLGGMRQARPTVRHDAEIGMAYA